MSIGLRMLHNGDGDAFVSAGNTGALHTGSTLIVRRIKGIKKSAIGTLIPFDTPIILLDSGANIDVSPEVFQQFAKMGSIYMEKILGVERPRVGLLNIGAEKTKGKELQINTYEFLSNDKDINFVGNIEGRDIPYGGCDVLLADGFTGNIVLKYTEGILLYTMKKVKNILTKNIVTKASALALGSGMKDLKKQFDPSERGGAPLLGLTKPVIKAHGSSDSTAIKHAVKQAMFCVNSGITLEIAKAINAIEPSEKKENKEED